MNLFGFKLCFCFSKFICRLFDVGFNIGNYSGSFIRDFDEIVGNFQVIVAKKKKFK